ncbi:MAG: hypothetical protein J7K96_00255 [Desulfobacteraceae bacterium]|nr:hypothetical protein [Desulfobacteraceae bacterium]
MFYATGTIIKTDYASWDQTEEAYQEEQAQWMDKLNQKKQEDKKTDECECRQIK